MLFLLFSITDNRYALPGNLVVEVIPNILGPNKNMSRVPEYFSGLINYKGALIPVIDLCQLHAGTPCPKKMSSRIILIQYLKNDGEHEIIGLFAEKITETIRVDDDKKTTIHAKNKATYLLLESEGMGDRIEIFDLTKMLPDNFDLFCLK